MKVLYLLLSFTGAALTGLPLSALYNPNSAAFYNGLPSAVYPNPLLPKVLPARPPFFYENQPAMMPMAPPVPGYVPAGLGYPYGYQGLGYQPVVEPGMPPLIPFPA